MAKDWLRKVGTNELYVRTPILALRNDMVPVLESDAVKIMELSKQAKESKIAQVQAQAVSETSAQAPASVNELDLMDEAALRLKAMELKIAVPDGAAVEKIRAKLKKVMAKDADVSGVVKGKAQPAANQTEADVAIPVVK